jgi:hypothetical protein
VPRDEELRIICAFYHFVLWLNPKIAKFPRELRFVRGERMERQPRVRRGNLMADAPIHAGRLPLADRLLAQS